MIDEQTNKQYSTNFSSIFFHGIIPDIIQIQTPDKYILCVLLTGIDQAMRKQKKSSPEAKGLVQKEKKV
ncbi:hypothetical protein DERP_005733 [Dermatophagoides pteronyssinus]|uniref:Uncharacterized protein n=1 Tax=Dermatophagoides pteronyssinus TaxID=6956 RepID=A0ABQ8J9E0_DERPT|nr:hypothetical protein DERP_005733 [Dermatophagoides pteronyssinus]